MIYCSKCGADNAADSAFCRKCGAMLEPEEETRVAVRNVAAPIDDDEQSIFSISPTLMFVKIGYVAAVIGAFFVVALFVTFIPSVSPWIAVLFGLLLLLIPAFYHIKKKLIKYTLTDTKIEIDEGFIARKTRSIPLRRIQDVTVTSGFVQRMLGYGDLIIDNAGTDGEQTVMVGIDKPKKVADKLLRQMRLIDSSRDQGT